MKYNLSQIQFYINNKLFFIEKNKYFSSSQLHLKQFEIVIVKEKNAKLSSENINFLIFEEILRN